MTKIKIFIGSSNKLRNWRSAVGDAVRMLSDKWEPTGVRVQLYCWEDFYSYYVGKSKQQEYIDELVLPSNLSVYVLANEIGPYTQKELDAKVKQDKSAVIVYCVPSPKDAKDRSTGKALTDKEKTLAEKQVKYKLKGMKLSFKECNTEEELITGLSNRVEDYIIKNGLNSGTADSKSCSHLYTTIPSDVQDQVHGFCNAIRAVDDMAEEYLNTRCRLYPQHHKELICETDYYTPLTKIAASDEDLNELKQAIELCDNGKRPYINIFTHGDIKRNTKIYELIDGKDIFTVSGRNMEVVKTKVFSWLLKNSVGILDSTDASCYIAKDMFFYHDRALADIDTMDSSGELKRLQQLVATAKQDLELAIKNDDPKKEYAARRYDSYRKQLALQITQVLSDWMYDNIHIDDKADSDETDLEELKKTIDVEAEQIEQEKKDIEKVCQKWQKDVERLTARQKRLSKDAEQAEVSEELINIGLLKEDILRKLVDLGYSSPQELCSTQLYTIGLYDTYKQGTTIPEAEDKLYARLVEDADKYGLVSSIVEGVRINTGNYYWRNKNYRRSGAIFDKAISNLSRISARSIDDRFHITHAFVSAIQMNIHIGNKELASQLLEDFKHVIDKWRPFAEVDYVFYAQYLTCCLASLDIKDDNLQLVEEAEKTFEFLTKNRTRLRLSENVIAEVFCYLPNMIARYYIDHNRDETPEDIKLEYCRKAFHYIDKAFEFLEYIDNEIEKIFYLGELYHQKGFLVSMFAYPECLEARVLYNHALSLRKQSYELTGEHQDRIAQTYINMGAFEEGLLRALVEDHVMLGQPLRIKDVLPLVNKARRIYEEEAVPDSEESEQRIIECDLLEGTFTYHCAAAGLKDKGDVPKSLELLKKCWSWNDTHPNNSYRDNITKFAGEILKKEGIV